MNILNYIKNKIPLLSGVVVGLLLGIAATTFAAHFNGIPYCSVFNVCGDEDDLASRLRQKENEIDNQAKQISDANKKAQDAVDELNKYKAKQDELANDIKQIIADIDKLQDSGESTRDKIKKETAFIRTAMDRIVSFYRDEQ